MSLLGLTKSLSVERLESSVIGPAAVLCSIVAGGLQNRRTMGIELRRELGSEEGVTLLSESVVEVVDHGLADAVRPLDRTGVGNELRDVWCVV